KQGHDIATKLEKHIIKHMEFVKGITVHVEPCTNCQGNKCNN
ncbi:cation transporter dimerization domain-containing protein, partial [Clostridioides difficile]